MSRNKYLILCNKVRCCCHSTTVPATMCATSCYIGSRYTAFDCITQCISSPCCVNIIDIRIFLYIRRLYFNDYVLFQWLSIVAMEGSCVLIVCDVYDVVDANGVRCQMFPSNGGVTLLSWKKKSFFFHATANKIPRTTHINFAVYDILFNDW